MGKTLSYAEKGLRHRTSAAVSNEKEQRPLLTSDDSKSKASRWHPRLIGGTHHRMKLLVEQHGRWLKPWSTSSNRMLQLSLSIFLWAVLLSMTRRLTLFGERQWLFWAKTTSGLGIAENFRQSLEVPNKIFFSSSVRATPLHLDPWLKESEDADYGNLTISLLGEEIPRVIIYEAQDFWDDEVDTYRLPGTPRDDDVEDYYAYDDDFARSDITAYDEDGELDADNKWCRRTRHHRLNFPTCNNVHEESFVDVENSLTYINSGYYRQVFSMEHRYGDAQELFAIKDLSYSHSVEYDNFEYVRMDAIVAERLSASPHTYDIYGFCGLSIVSEYFYHGDIEGDVSGGHDGQMLPGELNDEEDVDPQNGLTGIQKLVLSLGMAEALADLHGFADGLIIHDDVQLSQFLLNKDRTKVKLNDFNRAEFPLWDNDKSEYCRYYNGAAYGGWRAPEEYKEEPLTEGIDVWSLGNNMYSILTGLDPFYDKPGYVKVSMLLESGRMAYIDPRYFERSREEAAVANAIWQCYQRDPTLRVSIFEVVELLSSAVDETLPKGETRETILQSIVTRR